MAPGSEIDTMAILTTQANATVGAIHDRMPVIIAREYFDGWLDCRPGSSAAIADLLRPAPETLLEMLAVNPRLNNVRNEGAELWQPPAEGSNRQLI